MSLRQDPIGPVGSKIELSLHMRWQLSIGTDFRRKKNFFSSPTVLGSELLAGWCGHGGVELDHLSGGGGDDDISQVWLGRGVRTRDGTI